MKIDYNRKIIFTLVVTSLIIGLGSYLIYTAKKAVIPKLPKEFDEAIYPALHTIDKVRIVKETIYYNNVKVEGKKICLEIGHNAT